MFFPVKFRVAETICLHISVINSAITIFFIMFVDL